MSKLFIFNPTNEMAIADGGNGFIPSKYLTEFENNLDTLQFLFALPDDFVLVNQVPDNKWIESLSGSNILLPEFLELKDLLLFIKSNKIKINTISPWGWSPRMIKRVEEIIRLLPNFNTNSPNYTWTPRHKEVYGRHTALEVLKYVVHKYPNRDKLIPKKLLPVKAYTIDEVDMFLKKNQNIVVKLPHSSSGKGLLMLHKPTLNQQNIQWILGAIKQSGYVMIEPFYSILNHFSLQFSTDKTICKPVAFGAFSCNLKGGYECNYIGGVELLPEIKQFVYDLNIKLIADILSEIFIKIKIGDFYNGYFGVDMLLCQHWDGNLFFHPCAEINLRQNMGLVAHFLAPWIEKLNVGRFRIMNKNTVPNNDIVSFINSNNAIWNQGKLQTGLVALNPVNNSNHVAIVELLNINNYDNVLTFSDII